METVPIGTSPQWAHALAAQSAYLVPVALPGPQPFVTCFIVGRSNSWFSIPLLFPLSEASVLLPPRPFHFPLSLFGGIRGHRQRRPSSPNFFIRVGLSL